MLNRSIKPNAPVTAYKTYQLAAPLATHFRPGRCEEVNCRAYQNGWKSVIDESSAMGQMQADYIRKSSGRGFTETKEADGMTHFVFQAGQQCFSKHSVPLERPAIFVVRDGDYRGNPTGNRRLHTQPEDWVEDFSEQLDKINQDRS